MGKRLWIAALAFSLSVLLLAACGGASATKCSDKPGGSCVWAGNGVAGLNGDGLPAAETRLYWPIDLTFGPDGTAFVLDWNNHLVRKVKQDGTFETVIGEFTGDGPVDGNDFSEPGVDGKLVRLNHPTDIAFGPDGDIYFTAWHNHKIRRLDPSTGLVRTMGGRGPGYEGDGMTWDAVRFNQPKSLAFGPDGSMYVLDQRNQRVRKISPDGAVSTIVGTGVAGFSGDGGAPELAQVNFETGPNPAPSGGLAIGPDGSLYIADGLNYRVRRVDFARNVIETIAGNGENGSAGDGGPALQSQLSTVADLEFGPDGRLYMADTMNHCIRALDLTTGTIAMVWDGKDEGPGLKGGQRILNRPLGIAFDSQGHLYIVDTFNSRILRVTL
ncbi:MAG: hypothetical protein FJ271_33705 [Planctomycetes bacterium]|nr:hypothetical protein [Planctomycetota bacterium]